MEDASCSDILDSIHKQIQKSSQFLNNKKTITKQQIFFLNPHRFQALMQIKTTILDHIKKMS